MPASFCFAVRCLPSRMAGRRACWWICGVRRRIGIGRIASNICRDCKTVWKKMGREMGSEKRPTTGHYVRIRALSPFFSLSSLKEEQRYLILGYKVGMFEGVVHEDDEFAHDGGEGDLGGFAGGAQPLVKLLELTVGTGGDERGHVKGTPDRRASATDAAASVPLATFARMRCQSGQGRRLAAVERAQFGQFGQHAQGGDGADA